jgi:hypothetical protein
MSDEWSNFSTSVTVLGTVVQYPNNETKLKNLIPMLTSYNVLKYWIHKLRYMFSFTQNFIIFVYLALSLLLFFIFHFLVWSRFYYLQTLFFAQPFEIKYYHETWDILLFQGFSDLYLFLCFIFSFSILGLNLKSRKNLTSTYISI